MRMNDPIPSGARCFVDANVLAYALTDARDYTEPSRRFALRIETGELDAFSTLGVISDAIHATMFAEAILRFGLETVSVRRFLKRNYWRIKELTTFIKSAESLLSSRIMCLPVDPADVLQATHVSREHGLLTNDALIVALMQSHGITHLASNDDDFDHVPGITVWKPRP